MASPKTLNFFDLTVVGLGSALGVGVFVLVGDLSKYVAGPAVVVSIAVAGIIATLAGLCFAEFGAWFLKTDTPYSFSYSCNKENVAFIFGWALVLQYVAGTASVVKGVVAFIDALAENEISNFLVKVAPINFEYVSPYFDFISSIVIIVYMLFLAIGMKDWMRLKSVFVIGNIILLCIIIIIGSFKANILNWSIEKNEVESIEGGFAPYGFMGVVKGTAIVIFAFIGFERIGISGKEVKQQHRNIPLAVLTTTCLTTIALLGVGAVLTLMQPYYTLTAYAAFPFAFEQIQWTVCKWVVAVGAFMSFQTSLFGVTFPLSRAICAMANDGLLFHFLGKIYCKTNTAVMATILGGLMAAIAAGIFTFQQLVYLTVITTLFVYTLIAANVIILRYNSGSDENEKISESTNLFIKNKTVSLGTVLRYSFSCSASPAYLTEKIILGNIILFCGSSILLSVIFILFSEPLINLAVEAILPAVIFASVMILSLVSMMCQIKSQNNLYFRVPLVPLIPCLSIFLNIFLMVSFELSTWIRFLIWMVLGIIPHLTWYFFKCYKNEVGENSLYEINKMNTVKLNESVWKIKSKKNLFYEGATNPAFKDDIEDTLYEAQIESEGGTTRKVEKSLLQLKRAEVIQMADLIMEERAEPLKSNLDLEWQSEKDVSNENDQHEKIVEQLPVQEDKVHWECVAEIHSEKEFPQEIIALEIVDNTYNFLSEEIEESPKDDIISQTSSGLDSTAPKPEENTDKNEIISKEEKKESVEKLIPNGVVDTQKPRESSQSNSYSQLKEELLNKIRDMKNNKNDENDKGKPNDLKSLENKTLELGPVDFKKIGENKFNSLPSKINLPEDYKEIVHFAVETGNEAQNNEKRDSDKKEHSEFDKVKEPQDEQNKVKEFKEKLNHILKSQVNVNASFTKKLMISKFSNRNIEDADNLMNKEEKEENLLIKTLNKSQIRNKLEHLLSKGPPKRPSLRDSLIMKGNPTDLENSGDANLMVDTIVNGSDAKVPTVEVNSESDASQTNMIK